jgi:GNAT superfamily N-acetyltransferase
VTLELTFAAATADRWADVERLFGVRGACGGCWCMYWRLPRPVYEQGKGEGNRIAFRATIEAGEEPGVIAYDDGEPIGWCAVGPRETYPVLGRSRVLKPIDDEEVWSITCFFVARPYRGRGVTVALLAAAVEFARERGTRIVEGYPIAPRQARVPDAFAWTGLVSAFVQAGFVEVARRSETRPIMRYVVGSEEQAGASMGRHPEPAGESPSDSWRTRT